jgi:hypothetical protein
MVILIPVLLSLRASKVLDVPYFLLERRQEIIVALE